MFIFLVFKSAVLFKTSLILFWSSAEISLILTGQGTEEENETEIKAIIDYFTGISEWMDFKFKFLAYFTSGDLKNIDDVKIANIDYDQKINKIKEELN